MRVPLGVVFCGQVCGSVHSTRQCEPKSGVVAASSALVSSRAGSAVAAAVAEVQHWAPLGMFCLRVLHSEVLFFLLAHSV